MPALSYTKAKEANLINEKDVERLAIMYLIMHEDIKPSNDQYIAAAEQSGNTIRSYQEAIRGLVRKLKAKDCFLEDGAGGGSAPSASVAASKKVGGKKRRADGENVGIPAPKKVARGTKKTTDDVDIKEEVVDEESSGHATPDEV